MTDSLPPPDENLIELRSSNALLNGAGRTEPIALDASSSRRKLTKSSKSSKKDKKDKKDKESKKNKRAAKIPVVNDAEIAEIPTAAWTRFFKDDFPPNQEFKVSVGEALGLLGLAYRIWKYGKEEREAGRLPVIDPFYGDFKPSPSNGVPLGGIGSGSINRGWKGEFARWQLQPGYAGMQTVFADGFSVYISPKILGHITPNNRLTSEPVINRSGKTPTRRFSWSGPSKRNACVLQPGKNRPREFRSWNWGLDALNPAYHGLFPRAWTEYSDLDPEIKLTCRQVSPVIPHNYKESSYPISVFVWTIDNNRSEEATVSLMFTFQNGTGGETDKKGGHKNKVVHGKGYTAILMSHNNSISRTLDKKSKLEFNDPMSFGIGVRHDDDTKITYKSSFDTSSHSANKQLWKQFESQGYLDIAMDESPSREGETLGGALTATVTIPANESREIVFSLGWDIPIYRFGSGRGAYRRYTKFYGTSGDAIEKIVADGLMLHKQWEKQIVDWQQPILEDPLLPSFYKMALFNELYYIVDGGTVWTNGVVESNLPSVFTEEDEQTKEYGHFAYLEGLEYLMYTTYDVHFYASYALAMLWPQLELTVQKDFGHATRVEYDDKWQVLHSGRSAHRKLKGSVPHDLGNPGDDPWYRINSYNIQDTTSWKDLNSKFVLQVYRDYVVTNDRSFLEFMYPIVKEAIEYMYKFDTDNDGVVDNGGFPDQTYDAWTVQAGISAYCGGLWIAALEAMSAMAKVLEIQSDYDQFSAHVTRAKESYETKLWNGRYYNYDSKSNSIQADQLAGHWYAVSCGLPPVAPPEKAQSVFSTIFEYNVMMFNKGTLGAINGMKLDGKPDNTCLQSLEVWTGTTYGLAAGMLQDGLIKQAFRTAEGVIRSTYDIFGYQFQTPEAWDSKGRYRSFGYMRPLCIWAMQWAWERIVKPKVAQGEVEITPVSANLTFSDYKKGPLAFSSDSTPILPTLNNSGGRARSNTTTSAPSSPITISASLSRSEKRRSAEIITMSMTSSPLRTSDNSLKKRDKKDKKKASSSLSAELHSPTLSHSMPPGLGSVRSPLVPPPSSAIVQDIQHAPTAIPEITVTCASSQTTDNNQNP